MSDEAFADEVYQPPADTDQAGEKFPDMEDALGEPNADDLMDSGYSPPEKPRAMGRFGETTSEERRGETLEQRLAQEEPEQSVEREERDAGYEREVGNQRSGRLAYDGESAHDYGIDGGAATAEEAAMHIIDDDVDYV